MSVAQDKSPEEVAERHFLRFEAPDLILSRPEGELTREDSRVAWDIVRKATSSVGPLYWIVDISRLRRFTVHTMQAVPEDMAQRIRTYAVVGGNFQQRTILLVAIRAGRWLIAWTKGIDFEFFLDEDAARAWIDQKRGTRRACFGARPMSPVRTFLFA